MALKVGELFASFNIDSSGVDSALAQINQSCENLGSKMISAGAQLSLAVTAPIVKAAKDIYTAGTDFEAQMSKVQAIAGLDSQIAADAEAIQALTDKALEMGSTTEWTASQAGEALEYMAMAGWKTDSMLAALPSVMNLATAAGADLGKTSDIVTDAMTAFGLTLDAAGGDTQVFTGYVEHFSDVIAAAATNSNTNVELLGTSFRYVAPLAGSLGMSVDDVAVALGLMANAGIKSTTAGASLRNIISGLMGPTKKTAEACATLGVSLFDARGNTKDLATVMKDLRNAAKQSGIDLEEMQKKCEDLDAQLEAGTISQEEYEKQMEELTAGAGDFMTACVNLAGKQGLSGLLAIMNASDNDFADLTEAIANCDGATDQMAATMRDNAKGAVTIFKSAIEGLEISLWNLVSDSFKELVQGTTEIVQKFQAMDDKTKLAIMKFGALAAAIGPVLAATGKLVKTIPTVINLLSALTSPIGLVAVGLGLFAAAAIDADNSIGKTFESMASNVKDKLEEMSSTINVKISAVADRMPALCDSIMNGLNDLIPSVVSFGATVIVSLMDALTQNADKLAELGTTVITTIVNSIADALPSLIPSAVDLVASLATAIINNIPTLAQAAVNLMDGFIEGIANVDWATIGQNILDAIQNAIAGLDQIFIDWYNDSSNTAKTQDWASIGSTMINLIMSATTGIATAAAGMIENICNALNQHNWSENGSALQTIAQSLMDGIKDAIPKLAGVAVKIVEAISSLFTKEGAASQIMDAATGIAKALIDGIADILPTLSTALVDIVKAIGDGLASADWAGAVGNLTTLGQAIINAAIEAIKGAGSLAVGIVEALGTVLQSVTNDSGLSANLEGFADMLVQGIIKGLDAIGEVSVTLVQAIGNMLGKINWENVTDTAVTIAQKLVDGLVEGINKIGEVDIGLVTAIGDMISKIDWTKVSSSATKIADVMIDGIVEGFNALTNVSTDLVQAIGDMLVKINWTDLGDAAGSIGQKIIDGIVAGLQSIAKLGTELATAIVGVIQKIDWAGLGEGVTALAQKLFDGITTGAKELVPDMTELISAIGKGIEAAADGLGTLASTLIENIVKFILTPENWLKLIELGGEIIRGIAVGIENLGESILKGAFDIMDNVLVGLLRGLGFQIDDNTAEVIHSMATVIDENGEVVLESYETLCTKLTDRANPLYDVYDTNTLNSVLSMYNACIETGNSTILARLDNYSFLADEKVVGLFQTLMNETTNQADKTAAAIALIDLGLGGYISDQFIMANEEVIAGAYNLGEMTQTEFIAAFEGLGGVIPDAIKSGLQSGEITVQEAAQRIAEIASTTNDQAVAEANAAATGKGVTDNLSDAEETGQTDVETAASGVVDAATLALETLPEAAKTIGDDAVGGMADAIEGNNEAETQMETLADDVVKAALEKMTYETGYQVGYDYVDAMKSGIETAGTELVTAAGTIASDTLTAITDTLTLETGSGIGEAFAGGISDKVEAAHDTIVTNAEAIGNDTKTKLETLLSESNGNRISNDFTGGMRSGFSEARENVVEIAKSIVETVKTISESWLQNSIGASIGLNFSYGIASGIAQGSSNVVNAIVNLCRKAVAEAKAELDINSPSRVARDEIGMMFDKGLVQGLENGMSSVETAASNVSESLRDSFYIGDPSRGTVYTAREQVSRTAQETANATKSDSVLERAERIGRAIADRIIESGALESDVIMDKDIVGKKTAKSVSSTISRKAKETIASRSLQGVIG